MLLGRAGVAEDDTLAKRSHTTNNTTIIGPVPPNGAQGKANGGTSKTIKELPSTPALQKSVFSKYFANQARE